MTIISLPNGAGEPLGANLASGKPLLYNGDIWYVDSATGTDAASPAGKNRNKPLATLVQANTNAVSGDMIVLMDGHAETFTSALSITKNLVIVGGGSSGGKPTVKLTNNQAAGTMLNITSTYIVMDNIWFEENLVACSAKKVIANGFVALRMNGCYFECGTTDDDAALSLGGAAVSFADITNTSFVVTSTDNTDQPAIGMDVAQAALSWLQMSGVVFDAGVAGFANPYAMDLTDNAVPQLCMQTISLLNGADIKVLEATLGHVNVAASTGAARVEWADIT